MAIKLASLALNLTIEFGSFCVPWKEAKDCLLIHGWFLKTLTSFF